MRRAFLVLSLAVSSFFVAATSHAAPEIKMGRNGEGEVIFKHNSCVVYYNKRGHKREANSNCKPKQIQKAKDAMAGYRREQGLDRPAGNHNRPRKSGWKVLGVRTVNFNTDVDDISPSNQDVFREIKICVQKRAVEFKGLLVFYGNNVRDELAIRKKIRAGECTRNIDLKGRKRVIKKIRMRYETLRDNGPKAVVTVSAN